MRVITTGLIAAGAIIMVVNIVKSRAVFRLLGGLSTEETDSVKWFFRVHEILMLFFIVGYAVVAYATIMKIDLASDLFVGIIFFFGAVFVLTGVLLKSKMISSIKTRFDQAVATQDQLHHERKKLETANRYLTREIDERRSAETALQKSEAFLQNIIDVFPEQVTVINLDYSIALANARALENVPAGADPKTLTCHKASHLRDTPCNGANHPCPLKEILRHQKPVTMEHRHFDAQGNEMYVEIVAAPIYDEMGRIVQIIEVCHDITRRKHAAVALKESEERYKKLSEMTIEGICFHDNGFILDANDSFFKLFGYSLPELAGQNSIDLLIDPKDRPEVRKRIKQGYDKPYKVTGIKRDGTIFPLELEGRNTRYMDQPVRVAAFRDISERRQKEQELFRIQKMEAIGTLAGGIAHDFNNILSAIMGYTEMLSLETTDSPTGEKLSRILQASHRARDLVQQILAFSRQQEEKLQPVQISRIAREALKLLRASIPSTIDFRTMLEDDSGAILADPTRIHQVLMNLCTNASHAMLETGGTLTVRINKVTGGDIPTGQNPDLEGAPCTLLEVSDTGHGMGPETLQRIFEPYFTTKEPGIGTGLGLAAVHGIVKQTNGAIEVFSQPDEGTTFKLYFPIIDSNQIVLPEKQFFLQRGSEHILIVDDDQIVIEMTRDMLMSLGYSVDPRMNSLDALEAFRRNPDEYDLVITDQTMPHLPGDRLVEKLKAIQPDIPVVLCTGFSETLTPRKIEQLGINELLMKPIVMRELASTVRAVLDRK